MELAGRVGTLAPVASYDQRTRLIVQTLHSADEFFKRKHTCVEGCRIVSQVGTPDVCANHVENRLDGREDAQQELAK